MLDVHPLQLLHGLEHPLRTFDIVTVPAPLIDDGALPLEEPRAIGHVTLSLFQVIEEHLAIHYAILPPFIADPSRAAALLRTIVNARVKRLLSICVHSSPLHYSPVRRHPCLSMVDKSRYERPPRWPRQRRVSTVDKLRSAVAARMPYVLLAAATCALIAWYAYQRLIQ